MPLGLGDPQLHPPRGPALMLGGHVAKYDSPNFRGATPTGLFDQRSGTAPGSAPSRTAPPDAAIDPNAITAAGDGVTYELAGPPGSGKSGSPQVAGQNDPSAIMPIEADAIVSTGASGSSGLADHWTRKPGQQQPDGRTA